MQPRSITGVGEVLLVFGLISSIAVPLYQWNKSEDKPVKEKE